ncbi:MAG TPA: hypothetical protein VF517_13530 [Thermoleophilaceae bacterium]|jgi:hypothetical protein
MRNRELHDALRDFALESAALLTAAVGAGAELPYDVLEEPGTGSVLYRYQPLTAEFIGARWDSISAQSSFERAARALGTGAEAYLRMRGLPGGADSEPALRALLERLYEDATGFEFPEERFERVYAEFERTLYEHTLRASVVAPVHGLVLERERVELGGGLILARGDRVAAPPEAVWPLGPGERDRATGPNTVVALERDVEADAGMPAGEARIRFRRLLTALRLLKPGRVAFGAPAWGRADEGAWQPIPLSFGGRGRGEPWLLRASEGGELAELVELVSAARLPGRIAWALGRFEMGCERGSDAEALSDYLLALRAMLDADDETGRASLGLRLAALCAEESERRGVRARLETAFALERSAMGGAVLDPDDTAPGAVVHELEQHVRALLRDVVCGYLGGDLRSVADDILLASADPIEIRARDVRAEPDEVPDLRDPAPDLLDEPPPRAEEREEGFPEPLATGEHDPGLFARTGDEDWEEPDDAAEPDADGGPLLRRVRRGDGPGTAADPRSAAWRIASQPGPRRGRERPEPAATPASVMADEELTIADRPMAAAVAEPPVAEPRRAEPRSAEPPRAEPTVAEPRAEPRSAEPPVAEPRAEPRSAEPPDPLAAAAPEPLLPPEEPTSRIAALDAPEIDVDHTISAGVTPSADWDDDDCWSAPV